MRHGHPMPNVKPGFQSHMVFFTMIIIILTIFIIILTIIIILLYGELKSVCLCFNRKKNDYSSSKSFLLSQFINVLLWFCIYTQLNNVTNQLAWTCTEAFLKLYIPYFSLRELLGKENSITISKNNYFRLKYFRQKQYRYLVHDIVEIEFCVRTR